MEPASSPRVFAIARKSCAALAMTECLPCRFKHCHVIPIVAYCHGFSARYAQADGEPLKSPPFGDAWRQEIEDGNVARWVFGADNTRNSMPTRLP